MKEWKTTRLVIMGDSIADCGRARPVGEGTSVMLGEGYPRLLDAMARIDHPEWRLRVFNMATSGDRSRDLVARWQTDCLDLHPDCVLVMIGINDVWRYFDSPLRPELPVPIGEYANNLHRMAESAKAAGSRVLFASPFYLETNRADAMRAMTDAYRAAMEKAAREENALYADVQAAFDSVLAYTNTYCLSADRVHPGPLAQYVIAKTLLRAMSALF